MENYKSKYLEMMFSLLDEETKLHSFNVSSYAVLFGIELNLDMDNLKSLKIGGLLHDIGKAMVPECILKKNDYLLHEEYKLIKYHPVFGETILSDICFDKVKEIVRNHHERIDGKGYPDSLMNTSIPYLVKIISIVDSFDAMTSQRSYGKIKTIDEALNELHNCSISRINEEKLIVQQFDYDLVNKFNKLIKKHKNWIADIQKRNYDLIRNEEEIQMIKKYIK